MTNQYFISDLHIGHKNVLKLSPNRYGANVDEHDEWIVESCNSVVRRNDTLHILGDVCHSREKMHFLKRIHGNKILYRGNHDNFDIHEYMQYFSTIHGITKYKGFWLSHCPIHPQELFGKKNVHGHVHNNIVKDPNYISVCVEALNGIPISLDQLKAM